MVHQLIPDQLVLLLLVLLENHPLQVLLLLRRPLQTMVVLAHRLKPGLWRTQSISYYLAEVVASLPDLLLRLRVATRRVAKRVRHLVGLHLEFQYFLLVENVMDQDLSVSLQGNRPVALEVLPERLRLGQLETPRRDAGGPRLVHIALVLSMDDDVFVFQNIWDRLPVRINENASPPNGEFFLARVQRE